MEYAPVVQPLVMVVDDNAISCEFVETNLRRNDFEVIVANGCVEALDLLGQYKPEVILLDVALDDGCGYDMCATIRAGGLEGELAHLADVPILFVSDQIEETDRLKGFESGADDYIAKPFNPLELIYRIQAILRRSAGKCHAVIKEGPLLVDPRRRQILVRGQVVDVTPKEFELLRLLVSTAGRVFSRGELLERVWGYAAQNDTRTVDIHVGRLRQKLTTYDDTCGEMIRTVWGEGYQFVPLHENVEAMHDMALSA